MEKLNVKKCYLNIETLRKDRQMTCMWFYLFSFERSRCIMALSRALWLCFPTLIDCLFLSYIYFLLGEERMDFLMPKMNIGSQKDYFEGIDSRYYFYFRHNKPLFTQKSGAAVKSCTSVASYMYYFVVSSNWRWRQRKWKKDNVTTGRYKLSLMINMWCKL